MPSKARSYKGGLSLIFHSFYCPQRTVPNEGHRVDFFCPERPGRRTGKTRTNGRTIRSGKETVMILNTGSRTDIPAFFTPWLLNRIREGYVLVRSPYRPDLVTRYRLDPRAVDVMMFCSKDPAPLLPHLDALSPFRTYWHVTITPYGKDVEPRVPPVPAVLETFRQLSRAMGTKAVAWRYDPIFLTEQYDRAFHIRAFSRMAEALAGYTHSCVISFIDLYEKTRRNFPEARTVPFAVQKDLVRALAGIAGRCGMRIHLCHEAAALAGPGVDADGCFTAEILDAAFGFHLQPPAHKAARKGCPCLLGSDIGAYNTCLHGCRYCYANYDSRLAAANRRRHDPASPLLIGRLQPGDTVHDAVQESWIDRQLSLFP